MQSKFKDIKLFFLLIAGLVVLSHAFIPHHHHYSDISCELNHHQHSQNHTDHCHYFNELIVKNGNFDSNHKVKTNDSFVGQLSFIHKFIIEFTETRLFFPESFPEYVSDSNIQPIRGSPSYS